jgi:protein SCO1
MIKSTKLRLERTRLKKKIIALSILLVLSVIVAGCSNYKFKETINYEIADFTVTDHRGDTISLEDLKGEPWLAMFVFTNCTTVCSPMTYNMADIQEKLIDEGIEEYKIIGFSVDPENDTPEVMTEYLARHTVPDESKWHYVSGYDQAFIEQLALKSFKAYVKKVEGEDQVNHYTYIYLVDEKGVAVKYYTGYSAEADGVPMDTIVIDLDTLIEERLGK